ncbi:PTS glucose transporter subunit IIB [Metamycoplasma buccale]|uniref:PTS glucose transporter subunit IIB n=1 Tax=Metamycoplasma buccale TaxID=55602 RepID=UPI00398E82F3
MTLKQRVKYIFLILFTFGFIFLYWRKYQQKHPKNYLSIEKKLSFEYDELIKNLGSIENIKNVFSTQKVIKIGFLDRSKVNVENIKKMPGISGITFQSKSISLVIGNSAKYLEELILKEL